MDDIRLATPEQVERIRDKADYVPASIVLSLGEDLAVVKQVTELDPVVFAPETSNTRKYMFLWGLETWMRLTGVPAYYFNIPADDLAYLSVMKHLGAEEVSTSPQRRFRKALINAS